MAVKSSFKQQCPSCEAMVPIRDPGLIGRKIDCPKCKYRFVVEEPAEEADDEAQDGAVRKKSAGAKGKSAPQRRGDDEEDGGDDKPKKKAGGSSSMLVIGLALAAVAVVALAIGGWLLFGGDSKPSSSNAPANSGSSSRDSGDVQKEAPKGDEPKTDVKPVLTDATNLLPNDTHLVVNMPMERLLSNPAFKKAVLMTPGSFNDDAFQRTWGVPASELAHAVMALNLERKTIFSVMQTFKAFKKDQIIAGLKLRAETPIEGLTYYLVRKPMDSLSTFLLKGNEPRDTFTLHFVDDYTVIGADLGPMQDFLRAKGKPKHLTESSTQPAEQPQGGGGAGMRGGPAGGMQGGPPGGMRGGSGGPPAGMQGGGPPGGGGGPAGGPPGRGGSGGFRPPGAGGDPGAGGPPNQGGGQPPTPPAGGQPPEGKAPPGGPQGFQPPAAGGMAGGPPPGGGSGGFRPPNGGMPQGMMPPGMSPGAGGSGPAPASSSYLTVAPELKAVLDQVEKIDNKEQGLLLSIGAHGFSDAKALLGQQGDATQNAALGILAVFKTAGLLDDLAQVKTAGIALTELSDSKISAAIAIGTRSEKTAQDIEKLLATAMPILVALTPFDLIAKNGGGQGRGPGMQGGMMGMQGVPPGMQPPAGGFGGAAPPPGGGGSGAFRPPQGGGSGAFRPPQGGSGGFQPPPGGFGGARPPGGGAFPGGAGSGGGFQPPGMFPGMQPGGSADQEKGKDGDYSIWTKDKVVALGFNVNLKDTHYQILSKVLEVSCMGLKGLAEMSEGRTRIHDLAAATQAFLKDKGHFPQGAVPRAPNAERAIEWRPDQRMSWLVQLLPYIANGEYKDLPIDNEKTWSELQTANTNVQAGFALIPEFLVPLSADQAKSDQVANSYYVSYPGLKDSRYGATYFVGIAGVGLDAADYRADDPATAKLRGIFGYDRVTKPEEVKDGLENTILALQVPPEYKAPWIAGGGSTVRGVSEDRDCVQPFVCAKYKGKDGTFAIMADGKVRFIPATIDPKIFQALCTIAGSEKIKDLDALAPVVPPPDEPKENELKTQPGGTAPNPNGWNEVVSRTGRYSVSLPPGTAKEMTPTIKTPSGDLIVHQSGVELANNAGSFIVGYCDLPDEVTKKPDAVLEGVRTGIVATIPGGTGAVLNDKKIKYDDLPGLEFSMLVPGKLNLMGRLYLDKSRLYQLVVAGPPDKIPAKDIQTFFDSFAIEGHEKPAASPVGQAEKPATPPVGRADKPATPPARPADKPKAEVPKDWQDFSFFDISLKVPDKPEMLGAKDHFLVVWKTKRGGHGRFDATVHRGLPGADAKAQLENAKSMATSLAQQDGDKAKVLKENAVKGTGYEGWEILYSTVRGELKTLEKDRAVVVKGRIYLFRGYTADVDQMAEVDLILDSLTVK